MLAHQHRSFTLGSIIVVLCLGAVALSLLFLKTHPEHIIVKSSDGVVEVEGDVPSSVSISILRDDGASAKKWTAVDGGIYIVEPNDIVLPVPVVVRIKIGERTDDNDYAIGYFDVERSVWLPQETTKNEEAGFFETETTHFSPWALLRIPESVEIADNDLFALFDAARIGLPKNMRTYRIDMAYSTIDGDFILLRENASSQKCPAEDRQVREEGERISIDRVVSADIDGVDTYITLRAMVSWTFGDSCTAY
mgnify:CR=1 FL=1